MNHLPLKTKRLDGYLLVLILAALLLYSINLGGVPLRDWDEGTYGIVAREILRSGDWLHLQLYNQPFFDKPPLAYWLIAGSYQFMGIHEWSSRLVLSLLSALAIPLLYGVGRELFGDRLPAFLSALVYLTLLPIARHGRLAMLDGLSISWFLLLLWCLLLGRKRSRALLGVGVGFGGILLTKGILALLLGAIAAGFLLWDGQRQVLQQPWLWLGLWLGMMPVLLWYLAQGEAYGVEFWQLHFFNLSLNRTWENVDQHRGPPWYYLQEILEMSWPWLVFLPGALHQSWQQRQTSWAKLVLSGTVIFFLAISLMRTKLPWYVLPLYPFLALAIGKYLAQIWQGEIKDDRRFWSIGLMILSGCLLAGSWIVWDGQTSLLLAIDGLSLTTAVAAFLIQGQRRQFIPVLLGGMYVSLGLFFCSSDWVWELGEAFAVKPVAALIQAQTPAHSTVYTSFGYNRPSLDFYSDRRVLSLQPGQLQPLWEQNAYLLLDSPTLASLPNTNAIRLGTAEGFTLIQKSRSSKSR